MPEDVLEQFQLNPTQFIGIPFAILGAVLLSFGTQYQNRGVRKVEAMRAAGGGSLGVKSIVLLLKRPSWVVGTVMLSTAIVVQLTALVFSPLIVVQPIGALALVITAVLNSRISKVKLNRPTIIAVSLCVLGVVVFVVIAAFTAVETRVLDGDLITILLLLAGVLVAYGVAFAIWRNRMGAFAYIVGAGVLYGFLVTLAKVVISRIQAGDFEWLTVVCLAGMLVAGGIGLYFVQNAHASGPPDLVVAGLTVIDPLVAIAIGVVVLDEAKFAPPWAIASFLVTGLVAIVGVVLLSRTHPEAQAIRRAQQVGSIPD